jgi:hypothetical protein
LKDGSENVAGRLLFFFFGLGIDGGADVGTRVGKSLKKGGGVELAVRCCVALAGVPVVVGCCAQCLGDKSSDQCRNDGSGGTETNGYH